MQAIYDYLHSIKSFSANARLFLLASFAGALYHSVFSVLGNLYILRAGLTETFLGTMISAASFASVFFALPAGLLSDRIGRRKALVLAACIAAAMQLVIILFPSAIVILVATFLGGAASAMMMVSGSPFLAENSTREERAHLFSISSASYTVSGIGGSFLGGALPLLWARTLHSTPASLVVYRATLLTAFFILVSAVIPYFLIKEKPVVRTSVSPRFSFRLARPRLIGCFVIPELFMGLGAGLVIPFLNVYFSNHLGANATQIGLIFSVMSLITTIGVLGAPFLGRKYGKVGATVLTRLLSVPLLIVIAMASNLWFAASAAWLRSALMNMSNPLVGSFTMEVLEPSERATVSSILGMTWNLGWGISARLAGHIMKTYSYSLPYYFTAVLYTLSAITFYYFFAHREQELTAVVAD